MRSHQENPVTGRLIDRTRPRLIYLGEAPTPALWDSLWSLNRATVEQSTAPSRDGDQFVRFTSRFLKPSDGVFFEGGCGGGRYVAALQRAGFRVIGLDFAEETVRALNKYAPHLDVRKGDLRAIPLPDASVVGYWSGGVIEHFWDGYRPLASEMSRVVQDGGYLFCSFPYMNPLRRLKTRLGLYAAADFAAEPPGFYQFALSKAEVVRTMSEFGFVCLQERPVAGLKGILGELGFISGLLERLYSYEGSSRFVRASRRGCDVALTALGMAHSILLVFQRQPRNGTHG
jgi:SAM-dependent methyltransferase